MNEEAIYDLRIYVRKYDAEVEVDFRMPALLADQICKVVRDFYKED